MTILPVAYLGSVNWFARLAAGDCIIDLHEHYIKRSERNRTRILTANGPMELTVHLHNANRPCTPVHDMRIDYSKRWQHLHWRALVSAYASSPYFAHYAERFEPFYHRHFEWLVDYNLELTRTLLEALQLPVELRLSERYVEAAPDDLDLRPKTKKDPAFAAEPYFQVFSDRMAFVPNLSAADLLFAEGPAACEVLRGSLSAVRCGR